MNFWGLRGHGDKALVLGYDGQVDESLNIFDNDLLRVSDKARFGSDQKLADSSTEVLHHSLVINLDREYRASINQL